MFFKTLHACVFNFFSGNISVIAGSYAPPVSHRVDVGLDSSWQFIRQDVAGAQTNGFDDSAWTNLNLPHTWNNLDGQDGGNNYYRGIGCIAATSRQTAVIPTAIFF